MTNYFFFKSIENPLTNVNSLLIGKLGLDEFIHLWTQVKRWCEVFKKHDKDSNHLLHAEELREALREANLIANRSTLQVLVLRYGHVTR